MSPEQWASLGIRIFVCWSSLAFAVFVVRFFGWTDWRTTALGRVVMAFMLSIALVLVETVAGLAFGDYPNRLWVLLILLLPVALTSSWLTVMLIAIQREQRRLARMKMKEIMHE